MLDICVISSEFSEWSLLTRTGPSGRGRQRLRGHDIACGQIDIGNAATDMTARMAEGVPQADGSLAVEPRMDPEHVANAVVYMASLPLDANVLFMTVMATKTTSNGRGRGGGLRPRSGGSNPVSLTDRCPRSIEPV